jgi:hypothetical protein
MAKVLVTRILPPQTQARLLQQGLELTQWDKDCAIPRDQLLEKVQGKSYAEIIKLRKTDFIFRCGRFALFVDG